LTEEAEQLSVEDVFPPGAEDAYVKVADLIKATVEVMDKKYPKSTISEIVYAFMNVYIHAMGTGKAVQLPHVGCLWVTLKKAPNKTCSQNRYRRKTPFNMQPGVALSKRGILTLRHAIMRLNHVKNLDKDGKKVELVAKKWVAES
jgi:hypothetical protein